MSLNVDILGNSPLFLISNLRYRVNKSDESYKLVLPQCAYAESVVVKKIDATGALIELERNIDFIFNDSNRDTMSEDLIRATEATFSKQLYGSFYIPVGTFKDANGRSVDYLDLIVSFQSAFPNVLTSAADQESNPSGPTCTPELLKSIINDLIFVKGLVSGETTNYSTSTVLPSPLVTDYSGTLEDNYIQDEAHYVDTVGGKVVVRPSCGSFYAYDTTIVDKNGRTLVLDTDYTIRGLDTGATRVCEHESGVWRFMVLEFTSGYTGHIYISYHAFGGEVSVDNFINIKNQVQDLKDYVDRGSFITPESLGGTPLLQEIQERLRTLERYYRSLQLSGFRDMSNTFIATRDASTGANTSHWYRIAYLYKQVNSTDDTTNFTTFTKDSVRLKVRLRNSGIFFDLLVYANVKTEQLKLTILESDTDNGYALPSNYSGLQKVILPQFRLVWRKDGNYQYGAVLQIKIPVETYETIEIENHNKAGMGGWILRGDNNGTDNVAAENTRVVLPDGEHTWESNGAASIYGMATAYPSFKCGTLLWAGSIGMHRFDSESTSRIETLHPCINYALDCKAIKSITVCVYDRIHMTYKYVTAALHAANGSNTAVTFTTDELDNTFFTLQISISSSGTLQLFPWSIVGTKSFMMHRFDLRQISINTEGDE